MKFETELIGQIAEKLKKGEKVTNSELRKSLATQVEGGM